MRFAHAGHIQSDGQRCSGICLAIGIRLECGGQQGNRQCRELLEHMAAIKAIQGTCKRASAMCAAKRMLDDKQTRLAHSNRV